MIGLFIITHETIGEAYRSLAKHFFPQTTEYVHIFGVLPDESPEVVLARVQSWARTSPFEDILVMTDIFGATPCNIAQKLFHCGKKIALLTGLNAPMAIKAIQYAPQKNDLKAFSEEVKQAAINGILLFDKDNQPC
ncbi:MAG: PTS mannose transporter subunit IIA [Neisseriaceae bacterium]|nr:PTS mannose transporter subunit IIA [Neisseriaceae bacterium]MBQ5429937.1 PTS mannose transporter subunit IIA [Neisseriaceae bacterium]